MKKLMILAAVAVAAVTTQAASYEWKTGTGSSANVYVNGSTTDTYSGMAYLFLSSEAESVYNDWIGGKSLSEMSTLDSSSISSGKITAKGEPFDYAADSISVIFATEYTSGSDKFLYISTTATQDGSDIGSATISFSGNRATSQLAASTTGAYSGAGWYASVPEPTSGLLLLLGLAGLALKRKQV